MAMAGGAAINFRRAAHTCNREIICGRRRRCQVETIINLNILDRAPTAGMERVGEQIIISINSITTTGLIDNQKTDNMNKTSSPGYNNYNAKPVSFYFFLFDQERNTQIYLLTLSFWRLKVII